MMRGLSRAFRTVRDLCLVGIGVLVALSTPTSVEHGLSYPWSLVWSLTLLLGGLACIAGGVLRRPMVEVCGCLLGAVGFLTWAVAAVARPESDAVSWALALVFIAGAAGQGYRICEVIQDARPVAWPTPPATAATVPAAEAGEAR